MRPRSKPAVADTHSEHVQTKYAGLAHQFEDLTQQHDADTLGIWLFLVTEIMFFGGVFAAYAIFRWLYFAAFAGGSLLLVKLLCAVITVVMVFCTLPMTLSGPLAQIRYMQAHGPFLDVTLCLIWTFP